MKLLIIDVQLRVHYVLELVAIMLHGRYGYQYAKGVLPLRPGAWKPQTSTGHLFGNDSSPLKGKIIKNMKEITSRSSVALIFKYPG